VVVAAGPASAAPAGCAYESGYGFSSPAHNFQDLVSSAEGGGGTQLNITLTSGRTTTSTVTGSLQTTEGFFIASATETYSLAFAKAITTQVAYGFTWTVPRTWSVGYLHAGSDRQSMKWTYGHLASSCVWVVTSSGTANLPYHVPASWHNKQAVGGGNVN
jgi:hypothetical protein